MPCGFPRKINIIFIMQCNTLTINMVSILTRCKKCPNTNILSMRECLLSRSLETLHMACRRPSDAPISAELGPIYIFAMKESSRKIQHTNNQRQHYFQENFQGKSKPVSKAILNSVDTHSRI